MLVLRGLGSQGEPEEVIIVIIFWRDKAEGEGTRRIKERQAGRKEVGLSGEGLPLPLVMVERRRRSRRDRNTYSRATSFISSFVPFFLHSLVHSFIRSFIHR